MKLALGTAQFGFDYGITNTVGRVPECEVDRILEFAAESGIRFIDTAIAYGNSEDILGRYSQLSYRFKYISKICINSEMNADSILESATGICNRLRVNKLYGLLVHNIAEFILEKNHRCWKLFTLLKEKGIVDKIGVSVYSPKEAEYVMRNFDIDIIQIPLSLFDQRFIQSGLLAEFNRNNIMVFARSIFFQGILFAKQSSLPNYFSSISEKFTLINLICKQYSLTRLELIYLYLNSIIGIDNIIIGVTKLSQLRDIEDVFSSIKRLNHNIPWDIFSVSASNMLNPTCWPGDVLVKGLLT